MTAQSRTVGWALMVSSTSWEEMFSPRRLITSFLRSTKYRKPSSSKRPMSPVWSQPSCRASRVCSSLRQ